MLYTPITPKPAPLPNCDRGCRNDCSKESEDTADVYLPSGCEYAGPHDSNIYWAEDTNFCDLYCWPDEWGYYDHPEAQIGVDIQVDFKYNDCWWECEISDVEPTAEIGVACPPLPGKVVVEAASDVPCADANLAKYDLTDPNLADDEGAPLTKYWSYWAIVEHETKHATDWHEFYGERLEYAIAEAEAIEVAIDCDDPKTTTCQKAKDWWWYMIDSLFHDAYAYAENDMDDPSTPVDEAEREALAAEAVIEAAIAGDLPQVCSP